MSSWPLYEVLGRWVGFFHPFFKSRVTEWRWPTGERRGAIIDVVRSSDIVLFAVPLHETVRVMRELIPHTRPDQLLMDVTSLKVAPIREMLRSSASVVGLHPMFGGRVSSFTGQTLVACPVRMEPSDWRFLHGLFTGVGIRVKECAPEEHDRMMSIIQVLFHMTTMLKGRVLRDLGVDIAETMEFTSPSYRLEINLLGRMFAQSGELYSAITQMNPYTKEILDLFQDGLKSYEEWYESKDMGAFVRDFQAKREPSRRFLPKGVSGELGGSGFRREAGESE